VESAAHDRPVRVEYGSDVDTADVGSAFPSTGPYADSGWNTNNLALQDQSMLKYLDGTHTHDGLHQCIQCIVH
jgi:hypothetical protein